MERTGSSAPARPSKPAPISSPFVTAYTSGAAPDAAMPGAAMLGALGRTSSPASPTASPERPVGAAVEAAAVAVDGSTLERGISNVSMDSFSDASSYDLDMLTHTTSQMNLDAPGTASHLFTTSSEAPQAAAAPQPDMMNFNVDFNAEPLAPMDPMEPAHSGLSSVASDPSLELDITSSAWQDLDAAASGSDDGLDDVLRNESIMNQLSVSPHRQGEEKLYWGTFEALAEHEQHIETILRSSRTTQPRLVGCLDEATRQMLQQFFAICHDKMHTPGVYHPEESDWAFMKKAKVAVTSTLGPMQVQAVTEATPEPEPAPEPAQPQPPRRRGAAGRDTPTPRSSPPGQRRAMYVPAAGPLVPVGLRRCRPAAGTPRSSGYDRSTLTWNEVGPDGSNVRNAQDCYSYSGTSCCSAIDGSPGPALRCQGCSQFFFQAELGADLLTPGFLPHQRNYTFTCGWCSDDFHEEFQLTKPLLFEGVKDVFLNLMATHKRQDYKAAELQRYLFAHWNTLMFGWPPLEAERDPNGAGKKYRSIAPELSKKSIKKLPAALAQFQDGEKATYFRLYDQQLRPSQPMEMLRPGETWDNTCETELFPSPRPTGGGAAMSVLPWSVSKQTKPAAVQRKRGDSIDLDSTGLDRNNSRSNVDPIRGHRQRLRTPRSTDAAVAVVVDAVMQPAEPQLAESDLGMQIIAALSEKLGQALSGIVAAHNADVLTAGVGTPARVTKLLRRCCEATTSAADVFFAAVTVLGPRACMGRGLLETAAKLSCKDPDLDDLVWIPGAFEDLQESWVQEAFVTDDQKRVTIAKLVGGLGEQGAAKALCAAVKLHCMAELV